MPDRNRDFAHLLDELLAADRELASGRQPTVNFDYLAVADELHSGRIAISGDAVAAEYRDMSGLEAELDRIFEAAARAPTEQSLSTDPGDIANELGIGASRTAEELGKLRRAFAFKNHPDRVPAHLRDRAMLRMQLANTMIDEARGRKRA